MAPPSTLLRTAEAASISLALLSSGVALAESFLLVPRLLESPVPLMLRQWASTFHTSKRFFRTGTLPVAATFYLLAWTDSSERAARLYLAAAILYSSVGPYTWLVVMPTNRELLRRHEELSAASQVEELSHEVDERAMSSKPLVDRWGVLNLPRAVLLGVAGVLGLIASQEV